MKHYKVIGLVESTVYFPDMKLGDAIVWYDYHRRHDPTAPAAAAGIAQKAEVTA
jgi:hypothetical protein